MTTIAVDKHGSIASDGQTTFGPFRSFSGVRKIMVGKTAVYGCAGDGGMMEALIRWHEAGADPEKAPKGDWIMLVCDGATVCQVSDSARYLVPIDLPWGIGNVGEVALGAMLHGASAEEAVRLVATRHVHTGGEIQVVDIAEALGITPVREAAE